MECSNIQGFLYRAAKTGNSLDLEMASLILGVTITYIVLVDSVFVIYCETGRKIEIKAAA
jgi:hypothetical protein